MDQDKDSRRLGASSDVEKGIIFSIIWPPALTLIAALTLVAFFCKRLSDEAMSVNAELPSLVPLFAIMAGFVTVALAFLVYLAHKLASRVAGPMHRLKSHLLEVLSGESSGEPFALRKGDFLGDIANEINGLTKRCRERAGSDQPARELAARNS